MMTSQICQQAAYEAGIVANLDATVSMHNAIVPGRYLLVMRFLAWIPVRGDIGICSLEDHQDFVPIPGLLPERIVAGYMGT